MSQEDVTMVDPEESLVTRRSRRSTAGNRMEAALAEMALDTSADSMEDDQDFVNDKDEEDMFESDFESTDEEAEEDIDAGDRAVQEEERRARKDARSRAQKATAAALAKHKVTFNPQVEPSMAKLEPKVPNRRVSLDVPVDAETGEVMPLDKASPKKKRHSQRKHTVLNTSAAVARMKESEEKKAAMPKKVKTESRAYTQAELIARALDNEEGNLVEHRDYLKIEEEKRRRARVVRTAVEGPLIRWISKGEEVKVIVPAPPAPAFVPTRAPYAYVPYNTSGSTAYGQSTPYTYSAGVYPHMASGSYSFLSTASGASTSTTTAVPSSNPLASQPAIQPVMQTNAPSTAQLPSLQSPEPTSQPTIQPESQSMTQPASQPTAQPSTQATTRPTFQSIPQPTTSMTQYQATNYNPYLAQLQAAASGNLPMWPPPPPPPRPTERIEKVAKNYVVHELGQEEGVSKPPWSETMGAMFGDHVKWDEVKIYTGKGRPLSRPRQTCPITGRQAKYLDPRTGVPFADVRAYQVLTKLLNHEFVWNPALGCYVGQEEMGGTPRRFLQRSLRSPSHT
ncbi:putative YL1 nuclear protein [Lyophyllum shimeji]|uniref:YL1 nuclear protein n=1 Tax=Lyophyllum shimeji TaxID=47721 RepID=A0A9P3PJP6_LYOSH|nr:putative YL1 nuclear protein [Lyophyllum shimeji]